MSIFSFRKHTIFKNIVLLDIIFQNTFSTMNVLQQYSDCDPLVDSSWKIHQDKQ